MQYRLNSDTWIKKKEKLCQGQGPGVLDIKQLTIHFAVMTGLAPPIQDSYSGNYGGRT